MLAYSEERQVA